MPLRGSLVEFARNAGSGAFTAGGPTAPYVCVNKAIGGWMIGTYDVSINSAATKYIVDLKVALGNHEGAMNLAVTRGQWAWDKEMASDACTYGHIEMNQLTYSPELDAWARLCWADGSPLPHNQWAISARRAIRAMRTPPRRRIERVCAANAVLCVCAFDSSAR